MVADVTILLYCMYKRNSILHLLLMCTTTRARAESNICVMNSVVCCLCHSAISGALHHHLHSGFSLDCTLTQPTALLESQTIQKQTSDV